MIITDPNLIKALNEHGLWHGRAAYVDTGYDEILAHEAEQDHEPPAVFQGLYVSPQRRYAQDIANMRATFYESEPLLHRIYLRPGADVALDEDMLGAVDTWEAWRAADPWWFREIALHPSVAHLLPPGTEEQLIRDYAGEFIDEPDDELMGQWHELDFAQWANELTLPALYTWAALPSPGAPPNLVILNNAFEAVPPLELI